MIKDLGMQMQSQGMTLEQYMAFSGTDMEKMREDYREAAKKNVLRDIMLEQVAQKEKITVTEQELNYEIAMMAQMYRTPAKQIAKYLQENDQLSSVVVTILHRKAVKFIIDNSAIAVKKEAPSSEETKESVETSTETPDTLATVAENLRDRARKLIEIKEVEATEPKVEAPAEETKAAETPKVAEPKVETPAEETKATETPKAIVEKPSEKSESKVAEATEPKVATPAKETKED
jgi:hypothetical protein